jgi:23S rRNA (adenine2503-C2)-methyltransferase
MQKINIKDLPLPGLARAVTGLGEPAFRAKQLTKWLYQKRVDDFNGMLNVSKASRLKFKEHFTIEKLPVAAVLASKDGDAVKFGFAATGSEWIIESVLLIDGDRRTACLSSQIGCSLGCVFCETGTLGFVRNLSQAEIIGQLIGINDYLESKKDKLVTNIVFMGMGEALLNYDSFRSSLDIIRSEDAFTIGSRRITISTAGVVPAIQRLMDDDLSIGLAISLNASNNIERNRIMPINKKYPIESLVEISSEYFEKTGRPVTFEYVLVADENNGPEAIEELVSLLSPIICKINVIPVNPGKFDRGKSPSDHEIQGFTQALFDRGLTATVRKSRGKDIKGACGQLTASKFSDYALKCSTVNPIINSKSKSMKS